MSSSTIRISPPNEGAPPTRAAATRVQVGRIAIDPLTFEGALDAIGGLVEAGRGGMVFTPNVDHVVLAEEDAEFRQAYAEADLSLADGVPVIWAARLMGTPLPAKISGSDLFRPLVARAAHRGWRVYFLGAGPGVAARVRSTFEREFPQLEVVGTSSPNIDLRSSPSEQREIVESIRRTRPHLLFLALGAPKQEVWAARIRDDVSPAVTIGVGASFDFVVGTVKRAPYWMTTTGLEWMYRLASEPRRLWRRYLLRDPKFAAVVARQLFSARR